MLVTKKYYNQLIDKLLNYSNKYYNQGNSEISDGVFDSLLAEAEQIEKEHPTWIRSDSPTNNVMGKPVKGLAKVYHNPAMLSLAKSMNYDELKNWLKKLIIRGYNDFIVECKHDGLAIKLVYENGKLIQAATRGDGKVGTDVSLITNQINDIPKILDKAKLHSADNILEVRGEIFLTKSGLAKINEYLQQNFPKEKLRKNVRNTAAGLLRNEKPDINQSKYLKFSAYMSLDKHSISHNGSMKYLQSLGFNTTNTFIPTYQFTINQNNLDTAFSALQKYIDDIYAKRDTLDIEIDGMVIKVNNYSEQNQLGAKESVPNWAIAYKFPQEEKMSILKDVVWVLGSKGNITPVANIEPVNILGAEVANVTLHNIEEIRRLDLKIGDHIVVTRRGDVIPKIINVHKDLRTGDEQEINIPQNCPICGQPVVKNDVFIRCNNNQCAGRMAGKINDFIFKLNIKDVGPKIIDKLVNTGKLQTIGDLYRLTANDISSLDKEGDISATKIISRIKESKNAPLSAVIAGLGISGIGDISGKVLANYYKSLERFKNARFEELLALNDVGETTALNIINWIKNNQYILDDLINLNLGSNQSVNTLTSNKLKNKTFAFTGALSISRNKMSELIEQNGGIISSIKKGLDYLIIGNNAVSTKIEKARKYNAQVINESDFMKMLK